MEARSQLKAWLDSVRKESGVAIPQAEKPIIEGLEPYLRAVGQSLIINILHFSSSEQTIAVLLFIYQANIYNNKHKIQFLLLKVAESWNQDKNNTRVNVRSAHISELSSLWACEMNWTSLKSLETPGWSSGVKCPLPKIGFYFDYNDQSVSCAWPQVYNDSLSFLLS